MSYSQVTGDNSFPPQRGMPRRRLTSLKITSPSGHNAKVTVRPQSAVEASG